MMGPITKYTHQLASADNIPSRVREAFRLAECEKPGATHLELPEDVADETSDNIPIKPSISRRPVGGGANRTMTSRMLTQFVEKTGIPFVTTQLGKGVIDETNEKYLGCAALSAGDFVHRAIESADLIVNIGHDVIEKPPFFMEKGSTEVIHISCIPAEVDPVYFPQIEVVGDIANAIWQIKEDILPQGHWNFDAMFKARAAEVEHSASLDTDMRFPIYPPHLVKIVREAMPADGIIALDNGVYKIWFARNYNARQPNTVLLDNALATMGAGLPSAMGSAMVYPDRKILAICGDGGFMMNSQEMETAVRLGLNITVLVLRDDAYGMIRWKQANMGFEDYGLTFGNPDFVKYAEAYRAHGHRVESADHLDELINSCLNAKGVHLIDCPVDYSDNDRILNHEIKDLSAKLAL
jgi:acetolactate synthase-1/2/3 large subunit